MFTNNKSTTMCRPTTTESTTIPSTSTKLQTPSLMARYTCAAISTLIFSIWAKYTFVSETNLQVPGQDVPMHSYHTPLYLTIFYLVSLPILKKCIVNVFFQNVDMKVLLKESMVLYNIAQVILNGWMVWRFIDALWNKGHPFIGDVSSKSAGTIYAVWVHYCDKYLEFFDTYFMVLRGNMAQVSFLHVYHHFSISWAWWIALTYCPAGDSYFGALLNSWIHVLMYSYYALTLLGIPCPWKRYLTQAQLLQFTTVVLYTIVSALKYPYDKFQSGHLLCYVVQLWEMLSLFVLFLFFYIKSYGKKKNPSNNNNNNNNSRSVTAKKMSSGSSRKED